MYYILHGEDEFSRSEQLHALIAKMGDDQFVDLNTTRFDAKVSLGELQHACDAMPFLADKRLVIVNGLLTRWEARRKDEEPAETEPDSAQSKELKEYLTRLPDHARLVFVEPKSLAKNNVILKQAQADHKNAFVKEFSAPDVRNISGWIVNRVKTKSAEIEPAAVNELAQHIGNDLRLLDNEIEKLITYRGNAPIRAEDVSALVASVREADIFALVDAIGQRQRTRALKLLHEHLDRGAEPPYLFAMILRQFRLLLQVKDFAARNLTVDDAVSRLHLSPYPAKKAWTQATNFSRAQLEAIYRRLLDADLATKTSRAEPIVALDMLVVDLTK